MTCDDIIVTYLAATDDEVKAGIEWYPHVNEQVSTLSIGTGIGILAGSGIVAAYSINTDWSRNWELAFDTILWGRPRTDSLGMSVGFVKRIFDGENPMDVFSPRARKIRAFTQAIAYPNTGSPTVVDRHARDVFYGRVMGAKSKIGKGEYDKIDAAYREAASITGHTNHELQAITWLAWRRKIGIK